MKYRLGKEFFKKLKETWEEDPKDLVQDALEAGFNEDYEDALEYLDKGIYLFGGKLQEKETKTQLWELKAIALQKLERYEEALVAINKAIELDKKETLFWVQKEEILHDLEKYEESLDAINNAIKFASVDYPMVDLFGIKAHTLTHLKKYEEALSLLNKSLKKYAGDVESLYGKSDVLLEFLYEKSDVLLELERNEEALKTCDEGLKINPGDGDLLGQKGLILLNLEKFEEVISSLKKAIQVDSSDDVSWYNMSSALACLNKNEEALDALTVATALDYENVIEMKKDEDFDNLRNEKRFIRLANQEI